MSAAVPSSALRVAIVGCGLIGAKRAGALRAQDELVACYDVDEEATRSLRGTSRLPRVCLPCRSCWS